MLGPDHKAVDLVTRDAEPGLDVVDEEAAVDVAVRRKLGRILDDSDERERVDNEVDRAVIEKAPAFAVIEALPLALASPSLARRASDVHVEVVVRDWPLSNIVVHSFWGVVA